MNAKRDFQVVEVTGECCLLDAEGIEHPYWRRDGRPLAAGFYVVHWLPGTTVGRFNEDSLFEGPFRTRGGAEEGLPRIRALLAGDDTPDAGPRRPEETVPVVDDRLPPRYRRLT
jgi:hypothetical protein